MHEQSTNYNGWSNRETWLASLWLNNDEPSYRTLQRAYKHSSEDYECADWLEKTLRYQLGDETANGTMWGDLLSAAFNRIDWMEVIENNRP